MKPCVRRLKRQVHPYPPTPTVQGWPLEVSFADERKRVLIQNDFKSLLGGVQLHVSQIAVATFIHSFSVARSFNHALFVLILLCI
jgi:hypothetical protein